MSEQGKNKQRKQRTTVTLKEKNSIIQMIEAGATKADISKKYGITTSTIAKIAKKKDILIHKISKLPRTMENRSRIDRGENSILEKILIEWITEKRNLGIAIQGPMIREKAMEIHEELQKKTNGEKEPVTHGKKRHNFKASQGWLDKFKKRYGIREIAFKGEQATADKTSAEEFTEPFLSIIKKEEYPLDNIYNGDETGLYDGFTHPFKGRADSLPVTYANNSSAWMTNANSETDEGKDDEDDEDEEMTGQQLSATELQKTLESFSKVRKWFNQRQGWKPEIAQCFSIIGNELEKDTFDATFKNKL